MGDGSINLEKKNAQGLMDRVPLVLRSDSSLWTSLCDESADGLSVMINGLYKD